MSKKLRPDLPDADNPEWSAAEARAAVRAHDLSTSLQGKLARGQRGPQKTPKKIQTAIRYDVAVIRHFKEQGPGWQTRMNEALKKIIRKGIA